MSAIGGNGVSGVDTRAEARAEARAEMVQILAGLNYDADLALAYDSRSSEE